MCVSSDCAQSASAKRRRPNPAAQNVDKKKAKAGPKNAFERSYIPIPSVEEPSDSELDEDDATFFTEEPAAGAFLQTLDQKGIARCALSRA